MSFEKNEVFIDDPQDPHFEPPQYTYWQQVKEEIQKL